MLILNIIYIIITSKNKKVNRRRRYLKRENHKLIMLKTEAVITPGSPKKVHITTLKGE